MPRRSNQVFFTDCRSAGHFISLILLLSRLYFYSARTIRIVTFPHWVSSE